MADRLSLYDYLAFVVPGALILFVAVYGYGGWPRGEPGAAATLGLVAASFVVGYINAAVGNWIEPMMLGQRPGRSPSSLWGTLRGPSAYSEGDRHILESCLRERYGNLSPEVAFRLAYTDLQQQGLDGPLKLMNQHLGFTKGMATASAVALVLTAGFAWHPGSHLPPVLWCPVFAMASAAFVLRFRRFWRRFGDHVLRGALVASQRTQGDDQGD